MRVKVGNSELDVKEGEVVAVTIQADSIEGVDQVNSSYTSSFSLPPTKNNLRILGNVQALETANAYTDIEQVEVLDDDNRRVLSEAFLQIEEVTDSLQVRVLQGSVSVLELLGDDTLQDFDLGTLGTAFTRNEANVVANIDNDYTSGFTYARTDFGDEPNGTFAIDNMFPFVYYYRLIKAIIEYAGYTLVESSELPTNAFFRTCALAYAGTAFNEDAYFAVSMQGFVSSGGATVGYQTYAVQDVVKGEDLLNDFSNNYIPPNGRAQIHEVYTSWEITLDGTGNWRYKVRLFNVTDNVEVVELYDSGAQSGTPSTTITDSFRAYYKTDILEAGKQYRLEVDLETALNFEALEGYWRNDDGTGYTTLGGASVPNKELYTRPPTDYTCDPLFYMPPLSMKDFLKAVLQQFSGRLQVDSVKKTVTIRQRNSDFQDTANAVDWSGKINLAQPPKKKTIFGSYGRVNKFLYDNDDPLAELEGGATLSISNTKLADKYEVVKLPFSYSRTGTDGVIIPILDDSSNISNTVNPRCVHMQDSTATITVGSTSVSDYKLSRVFRLSFKSLLGDYYNSVNAILSRMEELTVSVKLTALDFEQLDLYKPYFIQYSDGFYQANGYYAIEKIDQYQGGGFVDVIFIALNTDLL